jgi:polyisoprenoid-binding protein YceI
VSVANWIIEATLHSLANVANPFPQQAALRYRLDSAMSMFRVKAFSVGVLSAFGHSPLIAIRDFEGETQFVANGTALTDVYLQVKVNASSLEVVDDISEKDRREIQRQMFDEVLDVNQYPEISYACSQIAVSGNANPYMATLNGELTLHGNKRPVPISARVSVQDDSLRASGDFLLRQSDFGIAPVKVAGGVIKLKDELKFTFDIVARKEAT